MVLGMTTSKQVKARMLLGKYGIGIVLLFLMLIIGILEPSFRTGTNFLNVATQVSINGLISFGMCLVITTGGIDLSVGAQLALVSCVLGQLITKQGMNALLAIIIAVLVSTFLGFLNGVLISRFHMFPFVVTLSSQLIIRGLAQIISGGQSIPLQSTFITDVYNMKLLGIPFPILYLTVATVAAYLL